MTCSFSEVVHEVPEEVREFLVLRHAKLPAGVQLDRIQAIEAGIRRKTETQNVRPLPRTRMAIWVGGGAIISGTGAFAVLDRLVRFEEIFRVYVIPGMNYLWMHLPPMTPIDWSVLMTSPWM